MLCDWQITYLNLDFTARLYRACLWANRDVLVHGSLPYEVEVELTIVRQLDDLGLLLIDEEIAPFQVGRSCRLGLHWWKLKDLDDMMDFIAFTFYV